MTGVVHGVAQEWFGSLGLAWGAWLSSPGAGILGAFGAVVAAWFAYRGIQRRIDGERSLAREARAAEAEKDRMADERERWWKAYDYLWANRDALPPASLAKGVQSLSGMVTTQQQKAMAEVFLEYLVTRPTRGRR